MKYRRVLKMFIFLTSDVLESVLKIRMILFGVFFLLIKLILYNCKIK